jgi:hypothetical protein
MAGPRRTGSRNVLKLLDCTGMLFCEGKASISADLAGIFERLGCGAHRRQIQFEVENASVSSDRCAKRT